MADPIFIAVAVLTVGTAIIALEARELIYGAISLAISMLGIAGFFLLLDAPFVAMFQILVYVGAVAVTYHIHSHVGEDPSALYYEGRQEEEGCRYCTDADNNVKLWGSSACIRAQWPIWRL